MKPRLRYRTDRAWFSRLLRRPARKRSGSILTTPEPALGLRQRVTRHQTPGRVKSAGASHVSSSRRRLRPVSNSGIEAACRLIAYARRAARYTTRAGGRTSATHRGIGPPSQPALRRRRRRSASVRRDRVSSCRRRRQTRDRSTPSRLTD